MTGKILLNNKPESLVNYLISETYYFFLLAKKVLLPSASSGSFTTNADFVSSHQILFT